MDIHYSGISEWLPNWVKRNWRTATGEPVKNKGVIQYLAHLLDKRPGKVSVLFTLSLSFTFITTISLTCQYMTTWYAKVRLEHVKGHSGDEGNDGADHLAVMGCSAPALAERNWDAEVARGFRFVDYASMPEKNIVGSRAIEMVEYDVSFLHVHPIISCHVARL